MGLFGGDSSTESSTTTQIPTGTQYQATGSSPATGLVLNLTHHGGDDGRRDTVLNVLDAGAVHGALAISQDAAARAAAITAQALEEASAARDALVQSVGTLADAQIAAAQQAAAAQIAAAGRPVNAPPPDESEADATPTAQSWPVLAGLLGAAWLAMR